MTNLVQTIEKDMKSIKLFSILVAAIIVSSCSSGGTSSEDGVNLTGNWRAVVSFTQTGVSESGSTAFIENAGVFSGTMTVAQNRVITPGTETTTANLVITIKSPDGCVWIFSAENAAVNGRTNTISAINDGDGVGFIGQIVSNREIFGSFSLGVEDGALICGLVSGEARFTR